MRVPDPYLSVADFWDLVEMHPQGRYEYIQGTVRDLHVLNLAALNTHEQIAANVTGTFFTKLREKKSPCRVYGSNTYFYLSEKEGEEEYLSPDVTISCDKGDHQREKGITRPSIVVEVLSKGTALDDRTWKRDHYMACPSIQAYFIVDPHQRAVTVYHRQENGILEVTYGEHDDISLPAMDITVDLDDIYYQVDF